MVTMGVQVGMLAFWTELVMEVGWEGWQAEFALEESDEHLIGESVVGILSLIEDKWSGGEL